MLEQIILVWVQSLPYIYANLMLHHLMQLMLGDIEPRGISAVYNHNNGLH